MPVTILVAEDSVTMRRVLEMTFAGEDAKVVAVNSGEAAVEKADEIRPDVVLADLSMEGMDGYAVAQEIRRKPALAKTAVIVLSSQKNPYNEAKGKAAGVKDFIVKPFDTQNAIDKVKQAITGPRASLPEPAPARAASPQAASRPIAKTATLAYNPAATQQAKPKPASSPNAAQQQFGSPAQAKPVPRAAMETKPLMEHGRLSVAEAKPTADKGRPTADSSSAFAEGGAAASGDLAQKLGEMGLKREQVEAVLALTHEVVEKAVWEIVPELAETIIREEIKRLTSA